MTRGALAFALAGSLLAAAPGAVRADDAAERAETAGVIVARVRPQLVLVWRANAAVTRFAGERLAGDALDAALVADAERVMSRHLDRAERDTHTIVVKLVYVRDADDPRYKIETLAGIAALGSVSADVGALRAHGRAWAASLAAGTIPAALQVDFDRDAIEKAAAPP